MNTERNVSEKNEGDQHSRLVMGRGLIYEIVESAAGDGSAWVGVRQWDPNGNLQQSIWIQKDLIPQICQHLSGSVAVVSERSPRQLPASSGQIQMRQAGKHWDKGEEALLVSLYLDGYSGEEIGLRLGRSSGAVTARLEGLAIVPEWSQWYGYHRLDSAG